MSKLFYALPSSNVNAATKAQAAKLFKSSDGKSYTVELPDGSTAEVGDLVVAERSGSASVFILLAEIPAEDAPYIASYSMYKFLQMIDLSEHRARAAAEAERLKVRGELDRMVSLYEEIAVYEEYSANPAVKAKLDQLKAMMGLPTEEVPLGKSK